MQTLFHEFTLEVNVTNEKGKTVKEKRDVTLCAVEVKAKRGCVVTIGMSVRMPTDDPKPELGRHIAFERTKTRPLMVIHTKDRRVHNAIFNSESIGDVYVPYSVQEWLGFFEQSIKTHPFKYIGAVRKSMKRKWEVVVEPEINHTSNGSMLATEKEKEKV